MGFPRLTWEIGMEDKQNYVRNLKYKRYLCEVEALEGPEGLFLLLASAVRFVQPVVRADM